MIFRLPPIAALLCLGAALPAAGSPAAVATAAAASAAVATAAPTAPAESLYARLGGAHGVSGITGDLIERAATDPRTRRSFDGVTRSRVKAHLAAQLCELTGGGCRRDGDDMRTVHTGLRITEAEFLGLVAILRDVLAERQVPIRARNELVALLAPMKRDVVER
jgi:hemoglobin